MQDAQLSLPKHGKIGAELIENRTMPWVMMSWRIERHPTTVMREVTAVGTATSRRWLAQCETGLTAIPFS